MCVRVGSGIGVAVGGWSVITSGEEQGLKIIRSQACRGAKVGVKDSVPTDRAVLTGRLCRISWGRSRWVLCWQLLAPMQVAVCAGLLRVQWACAGRSWTLGPDSSLADEITNSREG